MMKRMASALLLLILLVVFAACGASETTTVIPAEEYDSLHDKYLLYGTILAFTWDDAQELSPDYFPDYYAFYYLHDGGTFEADEEYAMYMPQDDVEAMVQSHFDVTTDFLRSGSDYRPEKEAYEFYGIGSASYPQITGAQQTGNLLTIDYDIINPADELIAQGTVSIEVEGEDFQYISNQIEWVDQ